METGTAKRLMIFIDENDRYKGHNLVAALVEKIRKGGCSGATVLRGMQGFGVHGQIHTNSIVDLATSLPVVIILIEEAARVEAILPELEEMVAEGLMVIDEVQVIRRNSR
jgi:hypothetical protein